MELERSVLIFDWYRGEMPPVPANKAVYCFVSHLHGDHYGSCIWQLRDQHPGVTYVLDRNIRVPGAGYARHPHLPGARVWKVRPHMEYTIGALRVQTLLSTDLGVAYLVETEGRSIFHAGDLNIWHWTDEPDRANQWQNATYRAEIRRLAGKKIDVAFLPVDPRLGVHGADGPAFFLEQLSPGVVFPMHYWDKKEESMSLLQDPRLDGWRDRFRYEDVTELP